MQEPSLSARESERLAKLHGMQLLDTEPEQRFDRITRTALRLFGAEFHIELPPAAPLAIFMTAKVQPVEVAHYCLQGSLGVIAKPFDPMQLAGQVCQLWESTRA